MDSRSNNPTFNIIISKDNDYKTIVELKFSDKSDKKVFELQYNLFYPHGDGILQIKLELQSVLYSSYNLSNIIIKDSVYCYDLVNLLNLLNSFNELNLLNRSTVVIFEDIKTPIVYSNVSLGNTNYYIPIENNVDTKDDASTDEKQLSKSSWYKAKPYTLEILKLNKVQSVKFINDLTDRFQLGLGQVYDIPRSDTLTSNAFESGRLESKHPNINDEGKRKCPFDANCGMAIHNHPRYTEHMRLFYHPSLKYTGTSGKPNK